MAQAFVLLEVDVNAGFVYSSTVYVPVTATTTYPPPAQDLSGGSATLIVAPLIGATPVLTLVSPTNITLGGVAGTYTFSLSPAQSLAAFTALLGGASRSYAKGAFTLLISGITVAGQAGAAIRPLEGVMLFGQGTV